MRTFISIPLSETILAAVLELQQSLQGSVKRVKWTKPENCHLTLKFLGEISPEILDTLRAILQPVAQRFSPFEIELGGVGKFPERGPLSVIWFGVKRGISPLTVLEQEIRTVMAAAAVPFDKKPFVPHFTIGRAKREERVFFDAINQFRDCSLGALRVEAFHVMESILHPQGSIYTTRIHFPLGDTATGF